MTQSQPSTPPVIDPNQLMIKLDGFDNARTGNFNPGTYNGQKLKLLAVQREKTWHGGVFGKGAVKYTVYQIGTLRTVVYKPFVACPMAMMMGLSLTNMYWDKHAVPMELYAKMFIDRNNLDLDVQNYIKAGGCKTIKDWMDQNNFELI